MGTKVGEELSEKRSLFNKLFGKKANEQPQNYTHFKMLNGYTPIFNDFSGNAYDSDIVRSAVDAIARNAAKLKPKHIRRINGQIVKSDSSLEKLLAYRPNLYMNAFDFYYKVITQLYMKNNAFVFADIDPMGGIKGFYPLNFSSVEMLEAKNAPGEMFARFRFVGGKSVVLPYQELIHIRRFFYKDDIFGEPSDTALNPTLELVNTTDQGIINAVKSSAFLRGLLKYEVNLTPEDLKKNRDDFVKDYMNITNNGGVAALDAKANYTELKSDPKMIDDKQMNAIKRKVYDYFGVNEKIINSTYNEQEWNAFYESVLEPIAIQLSLEFTSKLFTEREKGHGNEIIFEANRLQYASNQTKIAIVTLLMDRGMMSQNQGLEVFNLPPIEGGDTRVLSLNFVDASKANEYQLGEEPKDKEVEVTETDVDADNQT